MILFGLVAIQDESKVFGVPKRIGLAKGAMKPAVVAVYFQKNVLGYAHVIPADDGVRVFAELYLLGTLPSITRLAPQIWMDPIERVADDGLVVLSDVTPTRVHLVPPARVNDRRIKSFRKQGYLTR